MDLLFFFPLGFVVGVIGTVIGAGGGFLLSPFFLFLYPQASPTWITAVSLVAVSANSLSGSLGYISRGKIHWPSVGLFTICSMPGVFLGVYLTRILDRNFYNGLFGACLVALAIYLFWRRRTKSLAERVEVLYWDKKTKVIGGGFSVIVGVLSSLLGIGGGIVHVPLLAEFLRYPILIALGTSQTILAVTSSVAVADHWFQGDYEPLPTFLPYLCLGLVIGAQVGAVVATRISGDKIRKILSLALIIVGLRLFFTAFS
jgi:uncharacterized membrane protein YfcA